MISVFVESGKFTGFNNFYVTGWPWYTNYPLTFEEAVKYVNSGINEDGEKVELPSGSEYVRVQEYYRNWSHGELLREYIVRVSD